MDEAFRDVHPAREGREIPISNLYQRLGLKVYDRKAGFKTFNNDIIKELYIPLKYNFGQAAKPIVNIGFNVKEGDMIASSDINDLGVPVHSGISGVVKAITENGILISANY
jgi:hypothetical protein